MNLEFVGEMPAHSGQLHSWLASYYPVRTKDGQILGVGAMISDVTEHKRAEADQRLLASIVESSDDAIIATSVDGLIQSWNAGAERMYGYSAAEAVGQSVTLITPPERLPELAWVRDQIRQGQSIRQFETVQLHKNGYASPSYQAMLGYDPEALRGITALDLLHPDDRTTLIPQWRQLLSDGGIQANCRIRDVNGEWFWIESSGSTSERQGRRVFVIVSRDITERRRLEAQFLQSQKMESIGRLAGGIAHDFNNLLTAIVGYTGLALDSLSPDHSAHADLQEIQRAANRAAALTNQLLSFARKRVIEPSIFSLNDLIRDMESLLRRLIGEEIVLIIRPDTLLGPIRADPGQIEQVLVNLVVNARDAMPTGGTLTIATSDARLDAAYARQHAGAVAGAYALLSVSDTGIGMSPEVQAHIFEPFYTTKEHSQGTGLGLATCYGIVKQHSGYIWFSSQVGLGSTFSVYLPRVDGAPEQLPRHSAPTRIPLPRGDEMVLLVEDEPTLRALTARVLRELAACRREHVIAILLGS